MNLNRPAVGLRAVWRLAVGSLAVLAWTVTPCFGAGVRAAPEWLPPAGLLNTMTVHAKVRLPAGGYIATAGSRLAAFKGEAIRGVTTVFNGPAPEMQFQLAVGSNSATEVGLTLRAYDAGTDTVHEIEGTLSFAADSTLGTIVAPYGYVALPAVVNAPPTATPAVLQTATDLPLLIQLAGSDAEGDALIFRLETQPAHGALSGFSAATGAVTYRPAAAYVGTDSFTFAVTDDGEVWSAPATVTVTVSGTTLVTIGVSGGNVSSIEWGSQAGATPGADVGIDHLAPMAGMDGRAVYFIPPPSGAPALRRDFRASLTGERWQIAVIAGTLPVTLSWDPAAVPPGNWHLWELSGPGGAAVPATARRLADYGALAPVPAGQRKHFTLGLPDTLLLSGLTPATGLPTGGTSVTLTGSGFQSGAAVRFGTLPALSVTRLSATALVALAPAQAWGAVSVSVVNPDGGSTSLASAFTYNTPPTAAAGGPYEYTAGDDLDVSLNGATSAAGDAGDTLTLAWDVDGDGAYDDAAGAGPVIHGATLAAWLDAGTLRYGEPNPVALLVTDALGATSISQTTLIAYRGEWSFTLTVQDGSETHLTIGLAKAASDGLDALDRAATAPAAAPLSLLAAPGQSLTADYHAYNSTNPPPYSGWVLHIRAGAAGPCLISWDVAALAGLRRGGLWLFEASPAANGGTPEADGRLHPSGSRFNLATQSSLTVAAGETRFFRIVFGYLEQTLSLAAGWNLLSLPLAPRDATVAALLAAGRGQVAGSVWTYDGSQGAYRRATEMQALHGYWAYVVADPAGPGASLTMQGIPVSDADYPLAPAGTWQLAGVAQTRPLETSPHLIAPAHWWNASAGTYARLATGGTLSPGRGYWFCVRQAMALNPTPPR